MCLIITHAIKSVMKLMGEGVTWKLNQALQLNPLHKAWYVNLIFAQLNKQSQDILHCRMIIMMKIWCSANANNENVTGFILYDRQLAIKLCHC